MPQVGHDPAKEKKGAINMQRREFMKRSAVASVGMSSAYQLMHSLDAEAAATSGGMGIAEGLEILNAGKARNTMPAIRPEISSNPHAVFLVETDVEAVKDETKHFTEAVPQLHDWGKRIGDLVFVKSSMRGGSTFIKPNFTWVGEIDYNRTTGVYSSPDFIAGLYEHLMDIGNTNVLAGEGPTAANVHRGGGVYEAFDPVGLKMVEAGYRRFSDFEKGELNWHPVENSLIWRNIPTIRPVGDPDNFLINISSLKTHKTALITIATKNVQGLVPKGYGQFCTPWHDVEARAGRDGIDFANFQPNYYQMIEASYTRHLNAGYKRFDYFGNYQAYQDKGGWDKFRKVKDNAQDLREFTSDLGTLMVEETWIHRGLGNVAVIRPQLNISEGIITVDGDELHLNGIGEDYLTNTVLVATNTIEMDAVGTYIMGHDPREIWYLRVANEMGMGEIDPTKIDIYKISKSGEITPVRNMAELKRYRIGLNWLRREDPEQRLFW